MNDELMTEGCMEYEPDFGPRSISDDDMCTQCSNCTDPVGPLSLSRCRAGFPGVKDEDGYIRICSDFQ